MCASATFGCGREGNQYSSINKLWKPRNLGKNINCETGILHEEIHIDLDLKERMTISMSGGGI